MEEKYFDEISDWVKEYRQENKYVETETTEVISVELCSDIEYCTKDIQCEDRQIILTELSFETRTIMMESSSESEMISLDVENECESLVLVDTEITTEEGQSCLEMSIDVETISIERSIEYFVESTSVDVTYEKERDTVDFSGSAESKTIEIGTETFGERLSALIHCLTSNEAESAMEDRKYEFSSDILDREISSETQFVEDLYSQKDVKSCDFGIEVETKAIECSSEYSVKFIESGIDVYKNKCDVETETIEKKLIEDFSSYELEFLSADCERTEVVKDIVAESEDQEKSEMFRTEDESVCLKILMNDICTVVECNLEDANEEMEEKYFDEISDWVKEYRQENIYVETETTEVISVELCSDIEYCTKDIQCEDRQIILTESSFETRTIMMESFSESEMISLDVETECERLVLVDTETTTEEGQSCLEMTTDVETISIERSIEYFVESTSRDVIYEKERDTVDFIDTESCNQITSCVFSLSHTSDAGDVGIQVHILSDSFDFSSNYNYLEDVTFESNFNLDFDDDLSQQSFPTSDGFEWAEVGLELDSLPTEIGTQTLQISLCHASNYYDTTNFLNTCSSCVEATFTSIVTDCIFNENEYIMQYIRTNVNSEMIRTIKEIISENVATHDFFSQTISDDDLITWFVDTYGLNKLRELTSQNKYYVEESQNTDSIFSRSVFIQSESIDFNEILTKFITPTIMLSSNSDELEDFRDRFNNITEFIDERIVLNENEDLMELNENSNECQTQTKIIETRTAAIQTFISENEYISQSLQVDYITDEHFLNFTEFDDLIDEVNFESETKFRRTMDGTIICDDETQTIFENRSCAIQTRCYDKEMYSITTIVNLKEDQPQEITLIKSNINNYTQTPVSIKYHSNYVQTDDIDLSEVYWMEIINDYRDLITNFTKQNINYVNSDSQTEEQYLQEIQQYLTKEEVRSYSTTTISENIENLIIEERNFPKIKTDEFRYSVITESSQTDALLIKDDFESVFEDDINRSTSYTMKTQKIENSLSKVIDCSLTLPIDIKSVSHPSNNIKYPFTVAVKRGWINIDQGVYSNPTTSETMPIERAIHLKKIELMPEKKCPDVRRFGLFKEKIVTKIEKLRIKNVLNTETGDLYDERFGKEIGLLSENGEFYDKEAKLKISFEEAVLENYIEVFYDTEIVDSTVELERNFKISHIQDNETGRWYNFHEACEKGLVDLADATFKDSERDCYLKYDEAIRRGIMKSLEIINNDMDYLSIENDIKENVIRQQMSLSSESYASRTQSYRSTEFS